MRVELIQGTKMGSAPCSTRVKGVLMEDYQAELLARASVQSLSMMLDGNLPRPRDHGG